MNRLGPKIFYDRMADGLDLFKAYVVKSPQYAAKDRPDAPF